MMTCNHNHNRNRYSKSTVIMIILNRNHDFLSIYHLKHFFKINFENYLEQFDKFRLGPIILFFVEKSNSNMDIGPILLIGHFIAMYNFIARICTAIYHE